MASDPEFVAYACELFSGLGPIRRGRLFGGTALYIDDAMFAMISGDAIWMKSDADLRPDYEAAGSVPFSYDTKTGKKVIPGLMRLPDGALDDPDEALTWARRSLIPAEAAAKKRAKKAR